MGTLQSAIHRRMAFDRRLEVLGRELANALPDQGNVLDIGSGSGELARRILEHKPVLEFTGIDVVVRDDAAIPVTGYDGVTIPFEDNAFDTVLCVDMLHHTDSPEVMLAEINRVASRSIVVKDHNVNSAVARRIIGFTDWFANAQHGVPMTYNYRTRAQWLAAWKSLGLTEVHYTDSFGLYPFYSYLIFARDQDFICRLEHTV